jgi:hypothetical protein
MINIDKDTPLALLRLKRNLYIYVGTKEEFEKWKENGYTGYIFKIIARKVKAIDQLISTRGMDDFTAEDITHEEAVLYILKYDMEVV